MRAARRLHPGMIAALARAITASHEALTPEATECNRLDVTILPSNYRHYGTTITRCALCKQQVHRCFGNADRRRI